MTNEVRLRTDERLDDLLTHNLRIIQSPEVFSFSMDAVLLARFASVPKRGRILDLCTGNGVVPLLLSTRTEAIIEGVEIQPRLANMADRSVRLNGLQEQIRIRESDLKIYHMEAGYGIFDTVTVNPPYMPHHTGDKNNNPHYAAARHEVYCTLDDVVSACAKLVRTGGKVAMVHRPSRLTEIFAALQKYKLEPKRMRFVHPHAGADANMVLIEAMRDAKPDLKMLNPLIVYNENREYHNELLEIYYGKGKGAGE